MKKHDRNMMLVALVLLIAFFLFAKQTELFSISGLSTPARRILYLNQPVEFDINVEHSGTTGNTTIVSSEDVISVENFTIKLNGNDIEHQLTEIVPNQKYHLVIPTPAEGSLTIVLQSQMLQVDLKAPIVNIEHDIPLQAYQGDTKTIFVRTLTPQGQPLDADKVILSIVAPHTIQENIIEMRRDSLGVFSYDMSYALEGNYYFTITPSAASLNYGTQSRDATTVVLGEAPVPLFLYFMIGNAIVFVLVLIIRNRNKIKEMI